MILQPPAAWVNLFGSGKWSRPARSGRHWPSAEPDPLLPLRRNLTLGRKCRISVSNPQITQHYRRIAESKLLDYHIHISSICYLLEHSSLIYLNFLFELNVRCVISAPLAALNEIGKVTTRKHAPVFHYLDKQIDLAYFTLTKKFNCVYMLQGSHLTNSIPIVSIH